MCTKGLKSRIRRDVFGVGCDYGSGSTIWRPFSLGWPLKPLGRILKYRVPY